MDEDCPDEGMGEGEGEMGEEPDEPAEPGDGSMTNGDTGPPDTGTGLATGTSSSLAAILGVTALALVLGGYTFARRRR